MKNNLYPKILITNAYSWYNKGDAAIVITMIESLRKYMKSAEITVVSIYPKEDSKHYENYKVEVIENIANSISIFNYSIIWKMIRGAHVGIRLSLCAIFYRYIKSYPSFILTYKELILFKRYINSDIIISCGGGFIQDSYLGLFFTNIFQIYLSILLKKPTVIYAQSIGPFKFKFTGFLTKILLNHCSMITLRENISRKVLKKIGVNKTKIFVTADSAFALRSSDTIDLKEIFEKHNIVRPFIGITVRNWIFPLHNNPKEKQKQYEMIMAKVIDYLSEKLKATIVFIPQVIASGDDDRLTAKKVYTYVKNQRKFIILESDYSPEEIKKIIGQMDFFIGTRMHSNIFALSMNVPVIAISYEHKTEGIMEMLGLTKYIIKIENIRYEDIITIIDDAWINREIISKELTNNVKKLHEKSIYNAKLISEMLLELR